MALQVGFRTVAGLRVIQIETSTAQQECIASTPRADANRTGIAPPHSLLTFTRVLQVMVMFVKATHKRASASHITIPCTSINININMSTHIYDTFEVCSHSPEEYYHRGSVALCAVCGAWRAFKVLFLTGTVNPISYFPLLSTPMGEIEHSQ